MLRKEEGTILKIVAHYPVHPLLSKGATQIKQNHSHFEIEN